MAWMPAGPKQVLAFQRTQAHQQGMHRAAVGQRGRDKIHCGQKGGPEPQRMDPKPQHGKGQYRGPGEQSAPAVHAPGRGVRGGRIVSISV